MCACVRVCVLKYPYMLYFSGAQKKTKSASLIPGPFLENHIFWLHYRPRSDRTVTVDQVTAIDPL